MLARLHEIGEAARSSVMTLRELTHQLSDVRVLGNLDVAVGQVRADSRAIAPGDVFVAVRGRHVDGHAFIATAIAQGAAAVVVDHVVPEVTIPQVIAPSTEEILGELVPRALGHPGERLHLIGVTGTNGKTTTTYLLESVLRAAGRNPGIIGTVNYRWNGVIHDAPFTTPTPEVLHQTFARMAEGQCSHAVMEVSSAALAMFRLAGVQFEVAAFSNLTQDHLDVHGSMDTYRQAKRLLFADHLRAGGTAVVNVDDPVGADMGAAFSGRVLRVSAVAHPETVAQRGAEIRVVWSQSTVDGISARIATPRGELAVTSRPLLGDYNLANIALVVGIAEALGIDHRDTARGIEALPGVPGRVERVANDTGLDVLVDYAHTPDALRNVLSALRPLTRRHLLCVFGCGGDRDPGKRPLMGAAVAELADLAIVTSDNPRTEQPQAILDMILPAVPSPFFVDVDRATAIRAAVAEAVPGDIVLIAGKGHEDYQILGTTKIHFDDREVAAAAMALRPRWTSQELARISDGTVRGEFHGDDVMGRVVIDSRQVAPGDLYVAIVGEKHDGHDFCAAAVAAGARGLMVERGRAEASAKVACIEVADTRVALGAIARDRRRRWGDEDPGHRLVAITGSSGKTTTKDLTRFALSTTGPVHAADGSLNNETGLPLTLLGLRAHHRFAVVEMGMRGLGQIEYLTRFAEPDLAVVVNAGTAHLELLGSEDAIAQAKGEIWLGLRPHGVAIVPIDDERLARWARTNAPPGCRMVRFGEGAGADVRLVAYQASPHGSACQIDVFGQRRQLQLRLLGRHAAVDACAAVAAAVCAGADLDAVLAGLAGARPPLMRGEIVDIEGRHVIVDCYNANPSSMRAALLTLAEQSAGHRALAVVGDMLELGDHAEAAHRELGQSAQRLGLPVIALGQWKDTVAAASGPSGWVTDDPAAAARRILAVTSPGDWILLKASRGMKLERVLAALREVAP
jgi:murE/murF fusion protein